MTDLISRQAAINLAKDIRVPTKDGTFWRHRCIDPDDIRGLPSAQPDVVRCKDCKFYEIYELKADHTDDKRYKPSVCVKGKFAVKRSKNWYCADAERRTDETD